MAEQDRVALEITVEDQQRSDNGTTAPGATPTSSISVPDPFGMATPESDTLMQSVQEIADSTDKVTDAVDRLSDAVQPQPSEATDSDEPTRKRKRRRRRKKQETDDEGNPLDDVELFEPPPVSVVEAEALPTMMEQIFGLGVGGTGGEGVLGSTASSLLTHATGSPLAGSLGGSAVSSLAGAGGPLASMAGPAAMGAMAAMIVSQLNDQMSQTMRSAASGVADAAFGSGDDPFQSVLGSGESAAAYLDPIQQKFGINLNLADDALQAFIGGVREAESALVQMAAELAPYSGELSAAQAEADVRSIESDISRAETLGPELARFVEARSEASVALEEIKTSLARQLLPLLNSMLEKVTDVLQVMATVSDFVSKGVSFILETDFTEWIATGLRNLGFDEKLIGMVLAALEAWVKISPAAQAWLAMRGRPDPNEVGVQQAVKDFLQPANFNVGP